MRPCSTTTFASSIDTVTGYPYKLQHTTTFEPYGGCSETLNTLMGLTADEGSRRLYVSSSEVASIRPIVWTAVTLTGVGAIMLQLRGERSSAAGASADKGTASPPPPPIALAGSPRGS